MQHGEDVDAGILAESSDSDEGVYPGLLVDSSSDEEPAPVKRRRRHMVPPTAWIILVFFCGGLVPFLIGVLAHPFSLAPPSLQRPSNLDMPNSITATFWIKSFANLILFSCRNP